MGFFEWLGDKDEKISAERMAQLTYAQNFVVTSLFVQATLVLWVSGNYLGSVLLGAWAFFLILCLGLPPAPSWVPAASTPAGHQITGAVVALLGITIQSILWSVVSVKVF